MEAMSFRASRFMPLVLSSAVLLLASCGGPAGLPLLGGSVAGEYKGMAFTPTYGIAYDRTLVSKLIILGDEAIHCETPLDDDPPSGNVAIIALDSLEIGSYSRLLINLMRNVDGLEGRGSNLGRVTITKSSAEAVTASVAYSHVDDEDFTYELNGAVEVTRCPE